MPLLPSFASFVIMATAAIAAAEDEKLPPPAFQASLVCFNGEDGSGSNCRSSMAKIEGGLKVVTSKLTCGVQGAVSEITWTYRGRQDAKDLYHVVRRFPADSDTATTTDVDVSFDGTRVVLFDDESQCIVIELEPAEN